MALKKNGIDQEFELFSRMNEMQERLYDLKYNLAKITLNLDEEIGGSLLDFDFSRYSQEEFDELESDIELFHELSIKLNDKLKK